jgi:uncharacterized protein (DUF1810 family)
MKTNFDLQRFVDAQNPVYDAARTELENGRKQSHWMWFIFPQLVGLGHSANAAFYGIDGQAEAAAYMAHPVLGPRLVESTRLVMQRAHNWRDIRAILGQPDDLKFHSSITLFSRARPTDPVFARALEAIYGGVGCTATLENLRIAFIESLND